MAELPAHPAAFSVDLEDQHHAELVRRHDRAVALEPRGEASTRPLLELLERHSTRATFFVVGEVMERSPELIRRIAGAGHEIGCHTFTHRPLWDHTPDSFRDELRRFRAALERILPGLEPKGFRAPTFSMDPRTQWALRVLQEEGYSYDSSVVPARGPLYGCPGAPLGIYRPSLDDLRRADPEGTLVEFPAPVTRTPAGRLPVGGGFYLRVLPWWAYRRLLRRVLKRRPVFVYVHPWETDPATPRLGLPPLARWATYHGIGGMLRKVERLLGAIRFTTLRSAIETSGYGV